MLTCRRGPLIGGAALLAVVVAAAPVDAELCPNCNGKEVDQRVGVCVSCGGATVSRDFKLCKLCSRQQKRCQRCLASLENEAGDAGGAFALVEPAAPLNPQRSGTSEAGKWKYRLLRSADGKHREGELHYDNRPIGKAKRYDYLLTPWGPMFHVGRRGGMQGIQGWTFQPPAVPAQPGKMLVPPGSLAKPLGLTRFDDESTLSVVEGRPIVVILPGNPSTGYRWQLADTSGNALRPAGEGLYYPRPHPPGWVGGGGTFAFLFEAVRPGTTTVRLHYMRRSARDKQPHRTFEFTAEVRDP